MKIQSSFIHAPIFKNNLYNANYISSHVFYYTSHKRNIKGIIWDSYIPLSAYVKIDLCLVVSERICAINAALAVSFFYFHFLYSELTDVHRLAQRVAWPLPILPIVYRPHIF